MPEPLPAPESTPLQTRESGSYSIGTMLGHGGMGAVLEACDHSLQRTVAMKMLLDGKESTPAQRQRLLNEARILGRLEHPNIVPVYELAVNECDELYYTMKKVKGSNLEELLRSPGPPSLSSLLGIYRKVCDAIAYAHSHGVVHRDLKPSNIMIGEFGEVLVMDWGLASSSSAAGASTGREQISSSGPALPGLTCEGEFVGTPGFAPPEQGSSAKHGNSPLSDIYSLGAILQSLLVSKKDRPNPSLAAIVRKAMAEDPENRYADVSELIADLEKYETGNPTTAEGPNPFRSLLLFLRRHRLECLYLAVFGVVLLAASVAFLLRLTASQRKNLQVMEQLRASAPSFYNEARSSITRSNLPEARQRIFSAIALDSEQPSFYLLLARIEQISGDFKASDAAILQAQRLEPGCGRDLSTINQKYASSWKDNSPEAAGALARDLIADSRTEDAFALIRRHIREHGDPEWKEYLLANLAVLPDGSGLELDIRRTTLHDLRPISWIPLKFLTIWFIPVTDLSPLAGMPLEKLSVSLRQHTDITPLAKLPLKELYFAVPGFRELPVIAGMPLEKLSLSSPGLEDLSPLQGKPLKALQVYNSRISDLTPLKGMPLTSFIATGCPQLTSVEALEGMPLELLALANSKVSDLTPLRGMPLKVLGLSGTAVRDLSPIEGLPIEKLDLGKTQANDMASLQKLPHLEDLVLPGPEVRNFSRETFPNLKRVSLKRTGTGSVWTASQSADEFWDSSEKSRETPLELQEATP